MTDIPYGDCFTVDQRWDVKRDLAADPDKPQVRWAAGGRKGRSGGDRRWAAWRGAAGYKRPGAVFGGWAAAVVLGSVRCADSARTVPVQARIPPSTPPLVGPPPSARR